MPAEIHVGDVGTSFDAAVKDENGDVVDLSSAGTLQLWFEAPDGTVSVKAAAEVAGTAGTMRYVTQDGDLHTAGTWRVQGYVETGGSKIHTDVHKFKVRPNLR